MERRISSYTGCLLGLAAGDGIGHGQERINGFLGVSGCTQMAAYGANGLLLGLTRGQLSGTMAPPVRYIADALCEWARLQLWQPGSTFCWISRSSRMEFRRFSEPELLIHLAAGRMGTMEERIGNWNTPGALMTAPAVALFYDPDRISRRELQRLGAEAAALTHGAPEAFLSAAALTHILSRILFDGITDIERLSREAGISLLRRFGREYHQTFRVRAALKKARALARSRSIGREAALVSLDGRTAEGVLAGALYLCERNEDFEKTLEAAALWNPAAAAVTGAILGAIGGEETIPEELIEQVECAEVLRELGEDLYRGCPMMLGSKVFDIEWDEKYHSL
jgi:ADP-ribosylglycohydrolase